MRFFQVDCFADRPFAGNPNAVVLVNSQWPATEWLQQLAGEVNLPATAFVRQAQPHLDLRWFSPRTELTLCGSGTWRPLISCGNWENVTKSWASLPPLACLKHVGDPITASH